MTEAEIRPRWDGDTRGKGTSSAGRPMVDEVIRLEVAARRLDWVAEDPDAHLLPKLQAACAELPGWSVDSVAAEGATYVVSLGAPPGLTRPQARPAIYRLVAAVAEPVTFVREKTEGSTISSTSSSGTSRATPCSRPTATSSASSCRSAPTPEPPPLGLRVRAARDADRAAPAAAAGRFQASPPPANGAPGHLRFQAPPEPPPRG